MFTQSCLNSPSQIHTPLHQSQQDLTSNLLIRMVNSSAKDHAWPLPCFKYSWVFMAQNALKAGRMPTTHGLTVFPGIGSLLRSKEQDAKDFRLSCLCERRSQKECQLVHPAPITEQPTENTRGSLLWPGDVRAAPLLILLHCHWSVAFYIHTRCGVSVLEALLMLSETEMNGDWEINSI